MKPGITSHVWTIGEMLGKVAIIDGIAWCASDLSISQTVGRSLTRQHGSGRRAR
jgi:hypothetical protein